MRSEFEITNRMHASMHVQDDAVTAKFRKQEKRRLGGSETFPLAQIQLDDSMPSSYSADSVAKSVSAGYVAGISGVLIGHPFDSMKVWLQTKGATPPSSTPSATTSSSISVANNATSSLSRAPLTASATPAANNMSTLAVPSTHQERGFNLRSIRALYSGVSGPLATVGLIQSVNFAIYDSMRRILYKRSHPHAADSDYLARDSLLNVTISSMVGGGILACMTSPLLVIKTKQQIMGWNFQQALFDSLRSNKSIVKSFYVGFGPHCIAEVCGRGIYFCTYESLKRTFAQYKQPNESVDVQERCVSAALAGIVCWSAIFPFDALRSRMYAQALSSTNVSTHKSSFELARSLYREHKSLRPFYRGFGVTVLRAGPVAAAVLPIYDTTLEWLSRDT